MNIQYSLWSLPLLLLTTITQLTTAVSATEQRHVQPEEWAYTALRSLIQTSQCNVSNNLQNNQLLTRQEFASILSTCKSTIAKHIASAPDNLATRQNRARLARLLKDFTPELTTLAEPINSPEPVQTNPVPPTIVQQSEVKPTSPVPIVQAESPNLPPQINLQPLNINNSPNDSIEQLDAGFGMDWLLGNRARLQLAYGARNGDDPEDGAILGENAHAAGLQFLLLPTDNVLTGLSFIYGYSPDGRLNTFTGSAIADASGFINQQSNIYAASGTLQWRISPQVVFSTWGGLVGTYASETDAFAVNTNYMFSLGFPDLFQEGNVLGVLFGQPPKLVEVGDFSGSSGLSENGDSFHVEVFYQIKVNDNISITPGIFFVTNPGNIDDNNDIFIGTVRSTFRF